MRHRGTEFDVEEGPPSRWRWIIYPAAGLRDVIGEPKFRSREAAVAACIEEINNGIERSRYGRRERQTDE